jgi:glucose-1-phosphate cytidylyltransferase
MKTVVLAGGLGTRLAEETTSIPKPMVQIGDKPMLWHIFSTYAKYGFKDFVVACGYKGYVIKEYFSNIYLHDSDWSIDLGTGRTEVLRSNAPKWKVTVVDTGLGTMTGGRLRRLRDRLESETFMLTYGDGVADIDVGKLVEFHRSHGKIATVTGVRPPARFGELVIEENRVTAFSEKPQTSVGWINGGFFVFEPGIFEYLEDDSTILEKDPLEGLARDGELYTFRHDGFWQAMDTLRDSRLLQEMWDRGDAPWLA